MTISLENEEAMILQIERLRALKEVVLATSEEGKTKYKVFTSVSQIVKYFNRID